MIDKEASIIRLALRVLSELDIYHSSEARICGLERILRGDVYLGLLDELKFLKADVQATQALCNCREDGGKPCGDRATDCAKALLKEANELGQAEVAIVWERVDVLKASLKEALAEVNQLREGWAALYCSRCSGDDNADERCPSCGAENDS